MRLEQFREKRKQKYPIEMISPSKVPRFEK